MGMTGARGYRHVYEPIGLGAILFVAAIPCTWWAVGNLSEPPPTRGELDYILQPPNVSSQTEMLVGGAALAVGLAVIAGAALGVARGRWDRASLPVVALPGVAGVVIGFTLRVLTAGVAGAHQGGATGPGHALIVVQRTGVGADPIDGDVRGRWRASQRDGTPSRCCVPDRQLGGS